MYMIARQSFMKKVAFHPDDLPSFSQKARPYYARLISELMDEYKILCFDELHRTGGHAGLRLQLMTDGREARKWQMELILASQLMEDFGELTKIATSFFILDAGTEETRMWMRDKIGLTAVEERALMNYVHGATEDGATFLARFETKNAKYSQLFTSTIGPMRLWALTTTAEDRKLRSLVYAALPRQEARALLAARFPGGSCKRLVERLKTEQYGTGTFVDDDMQDSLIETIAKDMISSHYGSAPLAA
jgi:intracellular multiplication protein IcmB